MRKITKAGLIKKLDALVKQKAFDRDGECVTCPLWIEIKKDTAKPHTPSPVMQPGHYITRGAKTVKWDMRNVYQQCRTCNFLHELHPEVMANYVVNTLGIEGFEQLVFDGNQAKPSIHLWELEELYNELSDSFETHDLSVASEDTR